MQIAEYFVLQSECVPGIFFTHADTSYTIDARYQRSHAPHADSGRVAAPLDVVQQ